MRIFYFTFLFAVLFSCNTDGPTPDATPKPPVPVIKEKPLKPDTAKEEKPNYTRLILDNPLLKEVTIIDKNGVEKKSKQAYDSILLEEVSTVKFKVDGKTYEEAVGDDINVMINPGQLFYIREEIVYKNGKLSPEGPFEMPDKPIKRTDGGVTVGPYELIEGDIFIKDFTLSPEEDIPDTIRRKGKNNLQRFKKLRRYRARTDQ